MSVQLQKATQYHYYRTVLAILPLAPDQTIAQMWSNGARGVQDQWRTEGEWVKELKLADPIFVQVLHYCPSTHFCVFISSHYLQLPSEKTLNGVFAFYASLIGYV